MSTASHRLERPEHELSDRLPARPFHHRYICGRITAPCGATQLRHQLDGVIAGQILELEISEATAVRHVLVYAGDASIGHRI